MKKNLCKELYAYESGRQLGNPSVKFSYCYDHTTQKHLAYYCSECFHKFGDLTLESQSFIRVASTNISTYLLENEIIKPQPIIEDVELECKKCGKKTMHYVVDAGIGKLLQLLNRKGYNTMFSCEGHGVDFNSGEISFPYVLFENDVVKYFDKDNELLKYWNIEDYTDNEIFHGSMCLRVSEEAPISYVLEDHHLRDLRKYIKKYLPNLKEE